LCQLIKKSLSQTSSFHPTTFQLVGIFLVTHDAGHGIGGTVLGATVCSTGAPHTAVRASGT
jgi:hypothetical protein